MVFISLISFHSAAWHLGSPFHCPHHHQVPRSTYQPPKEQRLLEMTKRYNRWKAEVGGLHTETPVGVPGGGEGRGGRAEEGGGGRRRLARCRELGMRRCPNDNVRGGRQGAGTRAPGNPAL